jgi:hypothetical protein
MGFWGLLSMVLMGDPPAEEFVWKLSYSLLVTGVRRLIKMNRKEKQT